MAFVGRPPPSTSSMRSLPLERRSVMKRIAADSFARSALVPSRSRTAETSWSGSSGLRRNASAPASTARSRCGTDDTAMTRAPCSASVLHSVDTAATGDHEVEHDDRRLAFLVQALATPRRRTRGSPRSPRCAAGTPRAPPRTGRAPRAARARGRPDPARRTPGPAATRSARTRCASAALAPVCIDPWTNCSCSIWVRV